MTQFPGSWKKEAIARYPREMENVPLQPPQQEGQIAPCYVVYAPPAYGNGQFQPSSFAALHVPQQRHNEPGQSNFAALHVPQPRHAELQQPNHAALKAPLPAAEQRVAPLPGFEVLRKKNGPKKAVQRRKAVPVPEHMKDAAYRLRRLKNNFSARKSRLRRNERETNETLTFAKLKIEVNFLARECDILDQRFEYKYRKYQYLEAEVKRLEDAINRTQTQLAFLPPSSH